MTELLLNLNALEAHHPVLAILLDSFFKATLILVIAGLLHLVFRKLSAANLGLIWLAALTACLAVPLVKIFVPELNLEITVSESATRSVTDNSNSLSSTGESVDLISVLLLIYLAGLAGLLVLLGHSVYALIRVSRESRRVEKGPLREQLDHLMTVNGIQMPVSLRLSDAVSTPLTWGVFRHQVVLPRAALGWDSELAGQAISHELGHIQRNDWLCQLLCRLALILYWPNPLAWYAYRALRVASEKACDDAAIDCVGSDVTYAANLLGLASGLHRRAINSPLAMTLYSRPSILALRIRHILFSGRNRSFLRSDEILSTTLLILIFTVPFASFGVSVRLVDTPERQNEFIPFTLAEKSKPATLPGAPVPVPREHPESFPSQHDDNYRLIGIYRDAQRMFDLNGAIAETKPDLAVEIAVEPLFEHWEAAPLHAPVPVYPLRALRRGIEGYVVAEFRIDEEGRVFDTRIIEAVPTGVFENSVLKAVNQSVYCPEIVDGIGGNALPIKRRFSFALHNPI